MGKPNAKPQQVYFDENDHPPENPHSEDSTLVMVHECLTDGGIDPSDIDTVMSAFKAKSGKSSQESSRKTKVHQRYVFARANQSTNHLVDRGANVDLASADMRILQRTDRKINIVGIDDHELTGLDVVTAPAHFDTQKGPAIGRFHEYSHLGKERSIHADGKMEWFNCKVDDRSKVVGGAQRIETPDGYVFPLSIESGLVYMHSIWVPTDDDLQLYPLSSSHHLAFGIHLFWTMALHLLSLRKFTKKLMILSSRTPCLMNLEIFTKE